MFDGSDSAKNKTSYEDIDAGLNKTTRAEIRDRGRNGLAKIINFREAEARSIAGSPNDSGVSAGIQVGNDRRFRRIVRRNSRVSNRFLLIGNDNAAKLGRFPVIIRPDDRAGLIVQLEHGISQHASQTGFAERRSNRAQQNFLRASSTNNESADRDLVGQTDLKPGRDIKKARCRRHWQRAWRRA